MSFTNRIVLGSVFLVHVSSYVLGGMLSPVVALATTSFIVSLDDSRLYCRFMLSLALCNDVAWRLKEPYADEHNEGL